jgi:hypothetical protein
MLPSSQTNLKMLWLTPYQLWGCDKVEGQKSVLFILTEYEDVLVDRSNKCGQTVKKPKAIHHLIVR